ncbi:hypothetical protein Bca101_068262 [Brassica carinata]
MDSFQLLLCFSLYKSLFLASFSYSSIEVEKILLDTHPDGTHQQFFNLQRPQVQPEDRASSATAKPNGKTAVSSATRMNPTAAATLSSAHGDQVMFFRDVSLGPCEAELRFRLIHFWEARNPNTKTLIGQEMPLIDKEGTVIQGTKFSVRLLIISPSSHSPGILVYRFFRTPPVIIPEDRFRFHSYEEFRANCDSKDDLYDYVGHMKLVNGQTITDHTVLDEADLAEKRHLCVHVQTHDGPVMKLYLWDKAATDFCHKFKSYGSTPSVFLVTTVNPKHIGDIANRIAAEVVTKPESMTLEELFFYIKQEASKVAWFECTATIDDVVQGSAWYYISCGGCNSKAVKGPTSLICNNKKCGKSEVTGVAQYLTKISVYDKSEQAVFVILGDAAKELTGKHASELVASKTQTIIVTKILPQEAPQPIAPEADPPHLEEDTIPATSDAILKTGSEESCPSRGFEDTVGDKVRKANENLGSVEAKRPKSG